MTDEKKCIEGLSLEELEKHSDEPAAAPSEGEQPTGAQPDARQQY